MHLKTEKVNENTEQENKKEVAIIENNAALELNDLNLDQLITRIEELSSNGNPYSVSKDIENIKSIFYQKLRVELQTEDIADKEMNGTEQKSDSKVTQGN